MLLGLCLEAAGITVNKKKKIVTMNRKRVLVPGSPGQAFHTMKEEEVRSEGPGQDLVLEGAIREGRACPESPDLSRGVHEGVRSLQPTVRPGRGTYLWLMC